MFGFSFGEKRKFSAEQKLELVRVLLQQRMNDLGFVDTESKLHIKQMGDMELMGTAEATIITIIEIVLKLQKDGHMIRGIIQAIEDQRASLGQNPSEFRDILNMAAGSVGNAGDAIPEYCWYRINIEYPDSMNEEQLINVFTQATNALVQI